MTRSEAYKLLTKYLTNKNLIKHSLAAEAAMRALYKKLTPEKFWKKEDEETWGMVGLLHDIDYEQTKGKPEMHGVFLFLPEKLTTDPELKKVPEEIVQAIKAHNYQYTDVIPKTIMDWSIVCCDQLTGLIVAAALIHPEKKLAPLNSDFIINRIYDKSFAKGADRETIHLCEKKLGIAEKEFVAIILHAMQTISKELEL